MNTTRDTKLNNIKREIVMSLENCTCLGRDAYGDYINRLAESLMSKIKDLNQNEDEVMKKG